MSIGFGLLRDYKYFAFLFVPLVISGCLYRMAPIPQHPVAGAKSRIRIDPGLPLNVYPATKCYNSRSDEKWEPYTEPHAWMVAGNYLKKPQTTNLGMPRTSATPAVFNEYEVEANQPTMISVSFSASMPAYGMAPGYSQTCGPVYVVFVPRSGGDYEVKGSVKELGPLRGMFCMADIKEIVKNGNEYSFQTVISRPAFPCSAIDEN